jgi:hypothetical protein
MARVSVFECPSCSVKVIIPPLDTQAPRSKNCNNPICNADFAFTNSELQSLEVPDDLARQGYFVEADLGEPNFREAVYGPQAKTKTPTKKAKKKNLKGVYAKHKRRPRRPGQRS